VEECRCARNIAGFAGHIQCSEGAVPAVQGGGLSEGIDYEGNILSAIAIVGLPLAPPNLEVKALVGHFISKFGEERGNLYGYTAPALNTVVQGAGRIVRGEKDRGGLSCS